MPVLQALVTASRHASHGPVLQSFLRRHPTPQRPSASLEYQPSDVPSTQDTYTMATESPRAREATTDKPWRRRTLNKKRGFASEPTKEDISRLNSEINIYISQRWTLLVSAITITGAVMAWITQKVTPGDEGSINLLFAGTSLLLVFLSLIAVIDKTLELQEYIPSSFLRQTNSSYYEDKLAQRRKHKSLKLLGIGGQNSFSQAWPCLCISGLSQ
jgi:hypothetical protein